MDEDMSLQLREEELIAEKHLIQLGVVRIRRQVVQETRTVEVVVAREEMIVERLPIQPDGDSDPEAAASQMQPTLSERLRVLQLGETLRLPIVEEEIIIQKRPVVTQELIIDKRLVEEVRKVSGTVRREDARVTWLGAADLRTAGAELEVTAPTSDSTPLHQREDTGGALPSDAERTIELREEELLVGTQLVEAGTVEVQRGVVSEQRSLTVRVEHEETVVKQLPVERRSAERPVGSGEEIFDIPEYTEQVILRKRPVVTEQITVDKQAVQNIQQVKTTLRREQAQIEVEGDVRLHTAQRLEKENG